MAGGTGRRNPGSRAPEDRAAAPRRGRAPGRPFVAITIVEYAVKAKAGIGLETDTFFTLYFLLTGFHLVHVLLGIVVIAAAARHDSSENLRTGMAFWHMVDLVWVAMYPLIYLAR